MWEFEKPKFVKYGLNYKANKEDRKHRGTIGEFGKSSVKKMGFNFNIKHYYHLRVYKIKTSFDKWSRANFVSNIKRILRETLILKKFNIKGKLMQI